MTEVALRFNVVGGGSSASHKQLPADVMQDPRALTRRVEGSVMGSSRRFKPAQARTLGFCRKSQKASPSQSLANSGPFKARDEGIIAKLAQLVQVASSADDVVSEDRDLNMTYGIFGPTARTQTGHVHRLGGEH
jgi:hypothetical protein